MNKIPHGLNVVPAAGGQVTKTISSGRLRRVSAQRHMASKILVATIAFLTFSLDSFAAQWGWTIESVTNPATGALQPGPTTSFATKEQVLAAMRAMFPPETAGLRFEKNATAISSEITYQYIYKPKGPEYGAWSYTAHEATSWGYSVFAGPFTSEGEAEAALESERISLQGPPQNPPCPPPTFAPTTGNQWVSQLDGNEPHDPYGNRLEKKSYSVEYPSCTPILRQIISVELRRERTITCAAGEFGTHYSLSNSAPFCYQGGAGTKKMVGHIRGKLLECPGGFASPAALVGDPCNAATGDFYLEESDHASSELKFSRFYHSASTQRSELGAGWRHNYSRYVVLPIGSNTSRVGLIRANGHHDYMDWSPSSASYTSTSGQVRGLQKISNQWIVTLRDGGREKYNSGGQLIEIADPAGAVTSLSYTADRLTSVVGPNGHSLAFAYSGNNLTKVSDAAGQSIVYQFDSNDNLISMTYQDGTTRTYSYDIPSLPNHLTGIFDEMNNRVTTVNYDVATGRVNSSERAGGADRVDIVYQTNSSVVTDAAGGVTTYNFTTNEFRPRRVTGISRNGSQYEYQLDTTLQRRVERAVDYRGTVADYGYSGIVLASLSEAVGTPRARVTTYAYNGSYAPTQERVMDAQGVLVRTTNTAFNAQNRPTSITQISYEPDGSSVSRTVGRSYDGAGRMISVDGPRQDVVDVTTYAYYNCKLGYQCGEIETVTNALGQATTYNAYNAHGQPLTITDPNGVVTTLTYDLRQRLLSRTVGTEQTAFDYWPTGLLKKATLPDSSYLEYAYDAAHRLTDINDSEGNRIHYTLDAMGNRTGEEVFDPSNALIQTRTRVFNTLNRLWKEIGAAGTPSVTTEFGYDNNGNQTSIDAPLGRNTGQAYDELNRLTQVTDPATGLTKYGYNALDQLISVTDPSNKLTSYTYNAFGDLKQQVSPDTGTTNNTYDDAGNLKTRTDARSKIGTYSYDALNRVTQLVYPDQTIVYTYDQGPHALGRLTGISDTSGSTAWGYDPQGRVSSRQQVIGSISLSVGYSYNTAGQLQTLTLPSGNVITYSYANGKVSGLTLNDSTALLSNVLYQPFGPTVGWTWGNSTLAVREYDTDGKVTDIDSAGLKEYGYDDAFRITGIADADNPNLSQAYEYDSLDRLTSDTGTGLNQSWTYDANGNRLTQGGSQASTYTIATASDRVSSISGSLTRTYGYDAAGSITSDGAATFTYDDSGRMVSVTKAGMTTSYKLNGLGQRVRKTSAGASAYFAYDEAGHLIGEYDNAGGLIQETVWFGDVPVATLRPNGSGGVNMFYIHTDHLNTPRRISRPSDNTIVWRWDSDPFGTSAANEDPDADSNLFVYSLRFAGQYFDSETRLHYNYFRDYDPAVGRYVQSDPIGLAGGVNTYAYVTGNPISNTDPTGENPLAIPAAEACLSNPLCAASVGAATGVALTCIINPDLCKTAAGLACEDLNDAWEGFKKPMMAEQETLSAAEEEAIRAKNAGQPYDPATYNRARQKQIKNEKYAKERNRRKRGG